MLWYGGYVLELLREWKMHLQEFSQYSDLTPACSLDHSTLMIKTQISKQLVHLSFSKGIHPSIICQKWEVVA